MADGLHANSGISEGSFVAVKLISDTNQLIEAVGMYVSDKQTSVLLKHMYALVPQPDGHGGIGMGFMDFMVMADPASPVELNKRFIVSMAPAKQSIVDEVNKIINPSKLEVPKIIV